MDNSLQQPPKDQEIQPSEPGNPKRKRNIIVIVLIIIMLGVLASSGIFLVLSNQLATKPKATPSPTPPAGCYYKHNPLAQCVAKDCNLMLVCPTRGDENVQEDTGNWKTYTNNKYGYSVKYPPNIFIEENLACNENDAGFALFKKKDRGTYLCGSDERYYFSISVLNIDYSNDLSSYLGSYGDCYESKKENIVVDNITAEKFTTQFKSGNKKCVDSDKVSTSSKDVSIYITFNNKVYNIRWQVIDTDESLYDQILQTFKFL